MLGRVKVFLSRWETELVGTLMSVVWVRSIAQGGSSGPLGLEAGQKEGQCGFRSPSTTGIDWGWITLL